MDVSKRVTAVAQTVPVFVGDDTGTVTAHCKGTFAGANCIFEASVDSETGLDGTWFAIQALRSNANTAESTTGVLAAAPAYAWEFSVASYSYIRVRVTAFTSGAQIWTLKGHPGTPEQRRICRFSHQLWYLERLPSHQLRRRRTSCLQQLRRMPLQLRQRQERCMR